MRKMRLAGAHLSIAAILSVCTFALADDRAMAEELIEAFRAGSMAIEQDRLVEIKHAVESVAKSEPNSARWRFALAMVARQEEQRERAKELMQEAVGLDDSNAEYQYWLGNTVFEGIGEVSMFSKMSWSNLGKAAYKKAIELEPNHVGARIGLAQFYMNAPAIAGGSVGKAKQRAEELLGIDGGAFDGRLILAEAAEKNENWDEFDKQLIAAESESTNEDQRYRAAFRRAWACLTTRDDASSARMPAQTLVELKPNDSTARFVWGRVLQETGDHQGALEQYLIVMELNPGARNTRYHLGECYEATDQADLAVRWYSEFAAEFPDDDRAKTAKKKAKELERS